ncbi:MAG: non-canonical purine NTP pyrophosphatase, partial [Kiritimatiellia bacterium]|nr:non-canonical purine NTP pyrophosphatase [Kiritimatiellia bacterium]
PLFIPDGHDQTFAELPADVKNRISHRARALEAARKIWFSNDKNPAGDGI